ncbi:hypothetical protein ABB37_04989 [Leptomonas pyrrhocoris]|uniref:J domain-containing protein n=1 Tax=Leptomonas pyrrhocoris TaxID=157538 RepID=A0A0M9G0X7_LEPPY|nr:hypothetical protein ABB37_04989 [Leptomonas pyrrhocoris]KPA79937.1 hypothetical protein ABB37_04989 [Leptomonas pyrrhocoris]|eukprot:XP_015658376.1 hypothetical protein ABB37_04989 [Leptomonas pyrrhocoris]
MTRTFALRRPVLLTKDTSAAAAVATSGSRKSTPRAAPGEAALEKNSESPPANRPAYVSERRRPSSSLSCSATRFLAYAPVPPPPSSSQPRRSRRTSLASMTSNSSTSLHQHRLSVAEEAAATRLFFYPMVSLTEAQTDDAENRKADAESGAAACDAVAKSSHEPAAVTNGDGSSSGLATRTSSVSVTSLPRRSDTDHQPPQQPRRSSRHLPGAYEPSHGVVERLRERGNAFMMREEFSQAIATYSEGIRLAPSCDALWGNRAAALLLTFRYLPAVADCLYVLSVKPGNVKAYWRAAKAYAAAYRFLDAKKYYLLAQQACMQERGRLHSVPSDGLSFSNGGLNVDSGCGGVPAGRPRTSRNSSGSGNDPQDGNKQDKAARERQSIAAERAAVEIVEQYWQHVRGERWPEAVAVIDRILATPSYTGPTAVSWRALRLEALLPTQPKIAMAEADALHRKYPDALELHYVLAKALFYTMQDAASTRKCLQLLDEATAKRSTQNTMLNTHVRYAVMQLRDNLLGEGGDTAAVQLEAWARRNQLRDDSRVAELRHTIDKFAHRRDQGNSAYDKGNWDAAAAAYTQCLQTDRLNHALLAAVYCNRTAVYMQAGRWREALSDADSAIQLSPHLATAYSRRGRILLYLLSQEYEAQRAVLARHFTTQWSTAVKEQLMRYADAAVADLSRAVELSPAAELRSQLQQALAQRQTVKAALCAPQPGNARQGRSTSFSSSGQAFPRTGNGSANGPAHQRSYAGSRPASATSAGCVLQQHLQLLGVKSSDATAGVLPDFKVVSKAYRESALRWHPDKWVTSTPQERQEAERQFKMISVAYTFLRERYNDRTVTS